MKSPFTGGATELVRERKKMDFRKESFDIVFHSRKCIDTGEYFTTDELDTLNINQVYNKYREKHKMPFPDQIRSIREKYGLSATKMSELLGFGVNTWRKYESGDVPQASNGKLIKLVANPDEFKRLIELSDVFSEKEIKKILDRVESTIEPEKESDELLLKKLLSDKKLEPNLFTGYRELRLEKFQNMVVWFAEKVQPFKTRLNKLLFYADFLNYKKTGFSISGSNYRAIELGPVPDAYDTLYDYLTRKDIINIEYVEFADREHIGEKYKPNPNRPFDQELFDETEIESLNYVTGYFKDMDTQDVIKQSHSEKAWEARSKEKGYIEYDYAFDLRIGELE